MNSENKLEAHSFVCTNQKGTGENCGSKESQKLRDGLKNWAKETHPEWKGRWFTQLKQDDHVLLAQALTDAVGGLPDGR